MTPPDVLHPEDLNSKIIPFPTSAVIIPFPVLTTPPAESLNGSNDVDPRAGSATDMVSGSNAPGQRPGAAVDTKILKLPLATPAGSAEGSDSAPATDVEPLRSRPAADSLQAENIEVIDFQRAQRVILSDAPGAAPTELPGDAQAPEISAGLSESDARARSESLVAEKGRKSASDTRPAIGPARPSAVAEGTGITAAKQNRGMDSLSKSKQGSAFVKRDEAVVEETQPPWDPLLDERTESASATGSVRATEWPGGEPVTRSERPAPSSPGRSEASPPAAIDRISQLVLRETALVRQHRSDSMAVVLRPDANTELVLHVTQRNGQIETAVRCERGDLDALNALWPQLQDSLAQQKIRLAPLRESTSDPSHFRQSPGFHSAGDGNGSSRQSPNKHSLDERPAPAFAPMPHVRARGGSRRRLTTSRPGWETWA
jgi:hypothetical protein